MKRLFIIFLLSGFFHISAKAQPQPCNCPTIPSRYTPRLYNEIGISAGTIYSPNHEEWGKAAHIHYFRTISRSGSWSLGGSVEQAWIDGSHWAFAAGVKYQLDHFSLGVLPGVMLLNHDNAEKKTLFSIHSEIVYDLIHLQKFHLGPAIDFAWAKNHTHLMFGIHGALSF